MPYIIASSGRTVVSSEASALGSMACTGVLVAGHVSNSVAIFVGGSGSQALFVPSGQVVQVPVSHLNQLYAKTSAGSAVITWLALAGER